MYEKIVSGKFRFPSFFAHNIRDLCTGLIQNDLTKRYGNLKNGVRDIKEHKWFTDAKFNWLDVYNKKLEPPIVPSSKEGDTSHFETLHEEDLKESSINKFEKQFLEF
jgi:protein kinase A